MYDGGQLSNWAHLLGSLALILLILWLRNRTTVENRNGTESFRDAGRDQCDASRTQQLPAAGNAAQSRSGLRSAANESSRERQSELDRAARLAKQSSLRSERDALLKSIRLNVPNFIFAARLEFERQYRANNGEGMFGQEMSPLLCFGYHVGKTHGRSETERHSILEYAMAVDFEAALPFLPPSYRTDWGKPLSVTRFNRIYQHLKSMADLRDGRRNFEVAVSQWRSDAAWFHQYQRPVVEKFRAI